MSSAALGTLDADVLAAAGGDSQAFGRLVEATGNTVCSITLAILRDVESSEDVAQNVYLAAWMELRRLRNPASFLPWLRQLARNQAHKYLRGEGRRRRRQGQPLGDALLAATADPSPTAEEDLEQRQARQLVRQVLEELPDEAREVMTLFYREGQSVRQVSELLGLSQAAVKKRLSRARSKVRSRWLVRAGTALERTAPGSGFTTAVLTAVALAAPASAAFGAGVAGKAGSSVLPKLGALVGGAVLPAAVAIGASELAYRRAARGALQEDERRGFQRLRWVTALTIIVAALAISFGWSLVGEWWVPVSAYGGLVALLGFNTFFWVPRLMARRWALEVENDPSAARRHRRQRVCGVIGWLVGALSGALGLTHEILGHIPGF